MKLIQSFILLQKKTKLKKAYFVPFSNCKGHNFRTFLALTGKGYFLETYSKVMISIPY